MSNSIVSEITSLLENQRSIIEKISGLSDEQINWVPKGSKNSIGILLDHLTGAERGLIHQMIFGIEVHRDRDKEFESKTRSVKELVKNYQETAEESQKLLTKKLSDENLLEERMRRDTKRTVLWALVHVLEHNNYHIGQINLILAMLEYEKEK